MTIYEIYQIECDRCHYVAETHSLYSEVQSQEWADDHGWVTVGDNHFCPGCKMLEVDELEKEVKP